MSQQSRKISVRVSTDDARRYGLGGEDSRRAFRAHHGANRADERNRSMCFVLDERTGAGSFMSTPYRSWVENETNPTLKERGYIND